jgi:hypothetical protein
MWSKNYFTYGVVGFFLSVISVTSIKVSAKEIGNIKPIAQPDITEAVEGTMVVQPTVERINPGINPEFFGYRVEGLILKGANDCMAMDATVEIHSYVDQGVLYLVPARLTRPDRERVCPSLSQPIFELAKIDIRYSKKEIQKIVLRNVGEDLEDFAFVP